MPALNTNAAGVWVALESPSFMTRPEIEQSTRNHEQREARQKEQGGKRRQGSSQGTDDPRQTKLRSSSEPARGRPRPVIESGFLCPSSTIIRLIEQWRGEREEFERRDLSGRDYVYVWVDGIHAKVRLGADGRLLCLVIVGGEARRQKGAHRHTRQLPGV